MEELKIIYLGQDRTFDVAKIALVLENKGVITITLLTHLAELPELIEWFEESYEHIKNDDVPIDIIKEQSAAYSIYSFYDTLPDNYDNDDLLDKMYEYRSSHCLRFGMRGTNIPDICFAKKNNKYEVSLYNEHENWYYYFDLESFYLSIKKLKEFV